MLAGSAGVYGHLYNTAQPIRFLFDDASAETINLVADGAPHREVDLLFWEESKMGTSNIVILVPSTVYGRGGA